MSDWAYKLSSLAKKGIQGWPDEMTARLHKNLDYLCDKPRSGVYHKDVGVWSFEDNGKPSIEITYKIDQTFHRVNVQRAYCQIATPYVPEEDVFLSYSRKDSYWFETFRQALQEPLAEFRIHLWYDKEDIGPGRKWLAVIQEKVSDAKVALLLVSEAFLQTDFICKQELSKFLDRSEDPSFLFLWVPLTFKKTIARCDLGERVLKIQALHDPRRPLKQVRGTHVMDSRILPLSAKAFRLIYRHCRGLPL